MMDIFSDTELEARKKMNKALYESNVDTDIDEERWVGHIAEKV